jgi:hypothetical protein
MVHEEDDDEKRRREIREDNGRLLEGFRGWLAAAGLSKQTINRHNVNLDFYLNHFLLHWNPLTAPEGVSEVGAFLGDWFIRKAMWSSKASIKSNAVSLRKFYGFMAEKGFVKPEDLSALKQEIKEEMEDWLSQLEHHEIKIFDDEEDDEWLL